MTAPSQLCVTCITANTPSWRNTGAISTAPMTLRCLFWLLIRPVELSPPHGHHSSQNRPAPSEKTSLWCLQCAKHQAKLYMCNSGYLPGHLPPPFCSPCIPGGAPGRARGMSHVLSKCPGMNDGIAMSYSFVDLLSFNVQTKPQAMMQPAWSPATPGQFSSHSHGPSVLPALCPPKCGTNVARPLPQSLLGLLGQDMWAADLLKDLRGDNGGKPHCSKTEGKISLL